MIFPVLITSVVKLTAWCICSTTQETHGNLIRICLPRSSRSSWQTAQGSPRVLMVLLHVLWRVQHDLTEHEMKGHIRACHVMSFHVMSRPAMWCQVICRGLPQKGDINIMWHKGRQSIPGGDHPGSCAEHHKTWMQTGSLQARAYVLNPWTAYCCKSVASSRTLLNKASR